MMGIKFDTSLLSDDLEGIDVTAVLIMQGDRVKNWDSQGLVLPMISRLIVNKPSKYFFGK